MTEHLQEKTQRSITGGGSALERYQRVIVGRRGILPTIYFELCTWMSPIPGALGLALRKIFWPRLFGSCGRGVQFGQGLLLRHPHRVHLGDRVVLSEGAVIDARNGTTERVLVIGDDVMIANYVVISCKGGTLTIGARTGIGVHTVIQSTNDCPVSIGEDVIIGPRCYIVGGGNYDIDTGDGPISRRGIVRDSGVRIDDDVWLGAGVTVLSGIEIGSGAVMAAGAVAAKSAAARTVSAGVPAKVLRMRADYGGPGEPA